MPISDKIDFETKQVTSNTEGYFTVRKDPFIWKIIATINIGAPHNKSLRA